MRYPIAIESGSDSQAFGVVVPDLPGCFSAGDSLNEALTNAEEAILGWIETMLDKDGAIPTPSDLNTLRATHSEYRDWVWALVSIDPAILDDEVEMINITLPRRLLHRLDARAKLAGESRASFIAKMALS